MKRITCFLSSALLLTVSANSQILSWAKQIGGTDDDLGTSAVVDASGNVYITGQFTGTADFDPGPSTFNMTSFGYNDIFVTKLSPSGTLLWAKQMGGASPDAGSSIAIDPSGNIFVTGNFSGTADFDPGPGVANLNSVGGLDIFICKLDGSGNFQWAKSFGDVSDEDHGNALTVDAYGNVYTTGSFKGTVDFDPGPSTANLTADYIDVFVDKLDAFGNFVWAKKMGGTSYEYGYGIAVDAGNVYITGEFRGLNCDFDPGPGTSYLNTYADNTVFICKLDASGNFVWAKQVSSNIYDFSVGLSIRVDGSGNVYTTGNFFGSADFDPGPGTLNIQATAYHDCFALKLNSSGDLVWAKHFGGCQEGSANSVALDGSKNVYILGTFQYVADFDPGPGVFDLTGAGNSDIFLCKLDSLGNLVWAKRWGGTFYDGGNYITLDSSENIYAVGYFRGIADLDPGAGTLNMTVAGGSDVFIDKILQRTPQPVFSAVNTEYCSAMGVQKFQLLNLPDTTQISVTIKVDATVLPVAADSSFSISMNALPAGSHQIEVKYIYGTDIKTTTANFTVIGAQTPSVNVTASTTTVSNATPVVVTATNVAGGGASPLFTFGKDRNMTVLWQAESTNNTLTTDSSQLAIGLNRIYVRMRTSLSCYTVTTDLDSIDITRPVLTGIRDIDFPSQEITIYPVPFNRSFEIHGLQSSKTYSITLINSIGQVILQKTIKNTTDMVVTHFMPSGNYWLSLYDNTKLRLIGTVPLIKR